MPSSFNSLAVREVSKITGIWLVVSLVVGGIIPTVVQRFTVEPNEARLELEYVANNLEFTRSAYGLGDISVEAFSGDADIAASDIAGNRPTIDNLRLCGDWVATSINGGSVEAAFESAAVAAASLPVD